MSGEIREKEHGGKPIISTIIGIKDECEARDVKTFTIEIGMYDRKFEALPGQFVMVWVLGVDEIPMSISGLNCQYNDENKLYTNYLMITVKKVGEATQKLHNMKIGEKLGIRGPFGNSYSLKNGTAIVVGGGVGTASVRFLIQKITEEKHSVLPSKLLVIEGCKSAKELLFKDWLKQSIDEGILSFCTDDGSFGHAGFCSERLKTLIENLISQGIEPKSITVYACGPEKMLYSLFTICEQYNIELQASLERWMRCAFGVCGLCALEPLGLLVCKDGPIFSSNILRKVEEFGKYHRALSGKKFKI